MENRLLDHNFSERIKSLHLSPGSKLIVMSDMHMGDGISSDDFAHNSLTDGLSKNMNRSIILFSPFFYPEPISTGKYNTHLVKALQHQGCHVEVIALHPSYPDWKPKRTEKKIEGVNIWRGGGLFPYAKSQVLRRLELEIRFLFQALWCSLRNRKRGIVAPVFPPILFFPFINLFLPATTKRIGIVHDVMGVMAGIKHGASRRIVTRLIRIVEKRVFGLCDKLIFLSKGMARKAIKEYDLDPEKIVVCYPFATLEKDRCSNALAHLFTPGYKHIVYSGALGEKQAPYLLLELFRAIIKKRDNIICHIFSRGPVLDDLTKARPSPTR